MPLPSRRFMFDALLVAGIALTALRFLSWQKGSADLGPVPRERLDVGSRLEIHGLSTSEQSGGVVVFVQTSCPGSNASASFYASLALHLTRAGVPFFVVGRESKLALATWLKENAIWPVGIVSVPKLADVGVVVTPTLVRVDRSLVVTDIVSASLTELEKQRLFERITGVGPPLVRLTYAKLIRERDLASMAPSNLLLLDVRDRGAFARGHRVGATNIPHDEIDPRALLELPSIDAIAIDCNGLRFMKCEGAGEALVRLGAGRVFILLPGEGP